MDFWQRNGCLKRKDVIIYASGRLWAGDSKKIILAMPKHYFLPLNLALLLPNDFPSNPGLDLPFFLSFLLSFLAAMLSVRFFCFAAIEAAICSFRSSLANESLYRL